MRANIVLRCEDWQWGSAWRRTKGNEKQKKLLDESPTLLPDNYLKWINTPDKEDDLDEIRRSVKKGVPFGGEDWVDKMIAKHNLESTLYEPGRRRKL